MGNDLWYDKNTVDHSDPVAYNLSEDIRCLKEEIKRLKAEAVPNEQGKNRYGLDVAYFRNVINRELNRPLTDHKPDELARVLARMARTADPAVLAEKEFHYVDREKA